MTRHENRFGITSFIYRARLPFHPGRLYDYFLDPFFIFHGSRKEEIEETSKLEKLQKDAGLKQERRSQHLGGLMRSKGFVWIATSQYFMGAWQQAGNVLRVKPNRPWLCEIRHMWEGSPSEEVVKKELLQENGEVIKS
jgi:G3E family GTPase